MARLDTLELEVNRGRVGQERLESRVMESIDKLKAHDATASRPGAVLTAGTSFGRRGSAVGGDLFNDRHRRSSENMQRLSMGASMMGGNGAGL